MAQTLLLDRTYLNQVLLRASPLSLPDALNAFHQAARHAPREPRLLAWGQRVLQVARPEEWFAQAWWGCCTSFAFMGYLAQGRKQEVASLVQPPDWSPLLAAEGRGGIVVGAHVGPGLVASTWLQQRFNRVMTLASNNLVAHEGLVDLNHSYVQQRSLSLTHAPYRWPGGRPPAGLV